MDKEYAKTKRKRAVDPNDDEVVVVDEATRTLMILEVCANQLDRLAETQSSDDIQEAVSEIREIFGRRLDRKTIRSVIQRYESCPSAYRGQRKAIEGPSRRRKIQPGSDVETMVVELPECGLSECAYVCIINSGSKTNCLPTIITRMRQHCSPFTRNSAYRTSRLSFIVRDARDAETNDSDSAPLALHSNANPRRKRLIREDSPRNIRL